MGSDLKMSSGIALKYSPGLNSISIATSEVIKEFEENGLSIILCNNCGDNSDINTYLYSDGIKIVEIIAEKRVQARECILAKLENRPVRRII